MYQPDNNNPADALLMEGQIIAKCIAGIFAPVLAITTSFQNDLEWWLRIVALLSGITVSVLSIASLIKNLRK